MAVEKLYCGLSGCNNPISSNPKRILIQDFGSWKWYVDVCDEHYEKAHPSRKENKPSDESLR